ncbi:hypothetical protein ACFV4P_31160 [Kitasatospora sp. NPDC059795]|uniref:hypothetical protein n=1 Tax=Kitasatospora sp. NPDC059795 TaxID=3346949 RepID=UPI00365FC800
MTGLDRATYQHRRLLADYGFTPLAGSDRLVLTARTDNVFLHARQAVAALRFTHATVAADPAFDYADHPGYASPATVAAAAVNAAIITPGTTGPADDVVIGSSPEHGIVATDRSNNPTVAQLLAQHGFYRTPGQPHLFALTRPDADGTRRAADTVAALRAAGLHVTTDLSYEPGPVGEDPFATRIAKTDEQKRKPPTHAGPADPFLTKAVPAEPPKQNSRPDRAPTNTPAADPFNTRLNPAPETRHTPDARMAALVTNRQKTLATIDEILAGLSQQLSDDPQSLDPVAVSATLADAQTMLGGVRRDLEAVTAAPTSRPRANRPGRADRPAATPALSARAHAARTTSLQLGRVSAPQPAEAARRPEDPRLAYSIHTR